MCGGSPPAAFEFYIGGSAGPSLYVRLADGRLLYEWASAGGYSGVVTEASPAPEEWGRFREAVDRLGVREWEQEYVSAHSCCDVTYWHLRMEMDGWNTVVRGANAYPGSDGPEISKQFWEFLAAVKHLIGREP
ncbi:MULTISPECIES: hypothetical protein [Methanoculleus]|uniref:Uncharacterized protein n=2 Tax=Methanoculleus TaxID=45989 RepID=A3CT32_METMJ|nr:MULTISPECIES: hypothetical protein [Methanoculleus]ABN56532.1 hypothetical protein Memar_0599 [Methanoculleus marisnigri JR1]MCC7556930.1 hypothetical protein [Methanoculleus marisnigri]UYU17971.1 hypothetical protein OH143_09715 [Methanoculleus submarinus]